MKRAIVTAFGGTDTLKITEEPTPAPGPGEACVALSCIGMNHADLMARRGEYRLMSGEPPFTPGIEGGGTVEAVGDGVTSVKPGDRVVLGAGAPRAAEGLNGTYRSHYITREDQLVKAPDALPDEQLGALWLTYLTAWGCLVWRQRIGDGQVAAIPAASSGVGLAAAQIAKAAGARVIGLTTSADKIEQLKALPESDFDHIVLTRQNGASTEWHREIKDLTDGRGADVFFDPVASGDFLNREIRSLASGGAIWVYGLLGKPDTVDVSPLIRKRAAIRGWLLYELIEDEAALQQGYRDILDGFSVGRFRQRIDKAFPLDDVKAAHEYMERGGHIGKLILKP